MFIKQEDFEKAATIAKKFNNTHVHVETLVYTLLDRKDFVEFITSGGKKFPVHILKLTLENFLHNLDYGIETSPVPSFVYEKIVKRAVATSLLTDNKNVTFRELLYSINEDNDQIVKKLFEKYRNPIDDILSREETFNIPDFTMVDPDNEHNNEKLMKQEEQEFAKFTTNMNEELKDNFKPVISREAELKEFERVLLRKSKNSIIITGEPGVGKSNLVETFVNRINTGEVHKNLKNVVVYNLNVHSLLSDIKYHGIIEARISSIISVLEKDKNKILFIDELHMLYGAGNNNNNLDIMNFLKAPLSKNKIRIIGATTNSEYRRYIERNQAFMRRFCSIDLAEPSENETIKILMGAKQDFEQFYGFRISSEIVKETVRLSNLYIKNRFNPDKSLDILDSMLARKKLSDQKKIAISDVYEEIAKECRIPSDELTRDKNEQLEKLRSDLNEKIIGQSEAFNSLIDTLYISASGLRDNGKTMGNFLFQGPTSSGKTETAKLIAKTMGIPLIRYDMSAYSERHTVATLIGSPPGYVGFGDGSSGSGKIINDIEKNPHCVLLLDEIEKAHPDVLNILLQIMDYGKLTSSSGKDVYFPKVILIMTSNAGAADAEKNSIGFSKTNTTHKIDESISMFLAPEFRARIDSIIKFNKLSKDNIISIADAQLNDFNHVLKTHNIAISWDSNVLTHIADKAMDSKLGARFVQSFIASGIKTKIAKIILERHDDKKLTKQIILSDQNTIDIV